MFSRYFSDILHSSYHMKHLWAAVPENVFSITLKFTSLFWYDYWISVDFSNTENVSCFFR